GRLSEKGDKHRLAPFGVLVVGNSYQVTVLQAAQYRTRRRVFADDIHSRAFAHERHQRITGKKALGMMDQAYLVAVQRVRGEQQFEISKMRGQNQRAGSGRASERAREVREPLVGDPPFEPPIEEAPEPHVLGTRAAKVDVGLAQNAASLALALLGKSDLQVLEADAHVTAIQPIGKVPESHAERIQNKVRDQAQGVDDRAKNPEQQPALGIQFEGLRAARRALARELRNTRVADRLVGGGLTSRRK